eukprot:gene20016-26733_t
MSWPMSEFFGSKDLADCEVLLYVEQGTEEQPRAKRAKLASSGSSSSVKKVVKRLPGHKLALKAAGSRFRSLLDPENVPPQEATPLKQSKDGSKPQPSRGWFPWSNSHQAPGKSTSKDCQSQTSQAAVRTTVLEINIRKDSWLPAALSALQYFYAGPSTLSNAEQAVLCPMVVLGAELGARTLVEAVLDQLLLLGNEQCGFKLGQETEKALMSLQKDELAMLKAEYGAKFDKCGVRLGQETEKALVSLQKDELAMLKAEYGAKFDLVYSAMQSCVLAEYQDLEAAWCEDVRRKSFLALPYEAVIHVLQSKQTQVASENTACLAAGVWLANHRDSTSDEEALALLESIKLQHCSPSFLANVLPRLPLWGLLDKGRMIDLLYLMGHEATGWAFPKSSSISVGGRQEILAPHRPKSSMTEVNIQWEVTQETVQKALLSDSNKNGQMGILNSQLVHFAGFVWSLQLSLPVPPHVKASSSLEREVEEGQEEQEEGDEAGSSDMEDCDSPGGSEEEEEEEVEEVDGTESGDDEVKEEEVEDEVEELAGTESGDDLVKEEKPVPSQSALWTIVCQVPQVPVVRGASLGSFSANSQRHPAMAHCCHMTTTERPSDRTGTLELPKQHSTCHRAVLAVNTKPGDTLSPDCSSRVVLKADLSKLDKEWRLTCVSKVVGPIV